MKTYTELVRQLDELREEIGQARERETVLIVEAIRRIFSESGLKPDFILAALKEQDRRARGIRVRPKYWNPETGATWSGRGREPRWIQGKDRQQFLIDGKAENDEVVLGRHAPASRQG
ncbi:hypothetical protein WL93_00095 [Burkholderia diffusa]|uniref:H-NS histone family protein n=1 Tax=Burkholderia diffusa TaxID=488732 RepID=UPI00075971A8|nr:H-NS histone family protein [Burkholderia diffusa]KWF95449.1 hypothetical protein WL93_00095 [Burkholderia diffusa]